MSGAAAKLRYMQVAEDLRQSIHDGSLRVNDHFPTEAALCEKYQVSRFTVREALRRLEADGLISRRRGSGTRVQPAAKRAGLLRQPLSNIKEILQYTHDTRFDFELVGPVRLSATRARGLGVKAGELWYYFVGQRTPHGGGPALAAIEVFINRDFADLIPQLNPGVPSLFEQLETAAGIRISRVAQEIQAVVARRADAKTLAIRPRSPCLRILRSFYDASDRLVQVSISIHPGSRFGYSMHVER